MVTGTLTGNLEHLGAGKLAGGRGHINEKVPPSLTSKRTSSGTASPQITGGPLRSAKGLPPFPHRSWVSVPRQGRLGAGCPPTQPTPGASFSGPPPLARPLQTGGGGGCRERVGGEPSKGTCREMAPREQVSLTVKGSPSNCEPFYLLLSMEHRTAQGSPSLRGRRSVHERHPKMECAKRLSNISQNSVAQ